MKKGQGDAAPRGGFGHSLPSKVVSCVASAALATMMVPATAVTAFADSNTEASASNSDDGNTIPSANGIGDSNESAVTDGSDENGRKNLAKTYVDESGKQQSYVFNGYIGKSTVAARMTQEGVLTFYTTGDDSAIPNTQYNGDHSMLPFYKSYYDSSIEKKSLETVDGFNKLKRIIVSNGITKVGAYLFNQARNWPADAVSVEISDTVTGIGEFAWGVGNKTGSTSIVGSSITNLSKGMMGVTSDNVYLMSDSIASIPTDDSETFLFTGKKGCAIHVVEGSTTHKTLTDKTHASYYPNVETHVAMGLCGNAANASTSVVWTYDADGTLTLDAASAGKGQIADIENADDAPWKAYADNIKKIVLKKGVARIGNNAFASLGNVEKVEIAGTTGCGDNPFSNQLDDSVFSGVKLVKDSGLYNWIKANHADAEIIESDESGRVLLVAKSSEYYREYVGDTDIVAALGKDGVLTVSAKGKDTAIPSIDWNDFTSYPWLSRYWDGKELNEGASYSTSLVKEIVLDGVTKVGSCAFNQVSFTNLVRVRTSDSLANLGPCFGNSINMKPGTGFVLSEKVAEAGFWSIPSNIEDLYLANPSASVVCKPYPTQKKKDGGSELTGSAEQQKLIKGDSSKAPTVVPTVHVKAGSAATTLKQEEDWTPQYYTVKVHEDMGTCGPEGFSSDAAWTYDNGVLTVDGTGAIRDYASASDAPWAKYAGSIKKVVVKSGVTRIGDNAFASLTSLESVETAGCGGCGSNPFATGLDSSVFNGVKVVSGSEFEEWMKINYPDANNSVIDELGRELLTVADDEYYREYVGNTDIVAALGKNGVLTVSARGKDKDIPEIRYDNYTAYPWLSKYWDGKTLNGGVAYKDSFVTELVLDGVESVGSYAFNQALLRNLKSVHTSDSLKKLGTCFGYNVDTKSSFILSENVNDVTGFWNIPKSVKDLYLANPDAKVSWNAYKTQKNNGGNDGQGGTQCKIFRSDSGNAPDTLPTVHVKDGSAASTLRQEEGWTPQYYTVKVHKDMGTCGPEDFSSDAAWTYDDDGVLTVDGTGAIRDYASASDAPWAKYAGSIKKVVVKSGVTRIGNNAFASLENVAAAVLPSTIAEIGDKALNSSFNNKVVASSPEVEKLLEDKGIHPFKVSLGSGTASISGSVLTIEGSGAVSLGEAGQSWSELNDVIDEVVVKPGVTSIDADVFKDMTALRKVSLPASLESVGDSAFANCESLEEIYLPKACTDVATNAFAAQKRAGFTVRTSPLNKSLDNVAFDGGISTVKLDREHSLRVLLIGNSHFTDLRSSLASTLSAAGYEDAVVKNVMNGGSSGNLQHYADYFDNDKYFKDTQYSTITGTIGNITAAEDWDVVMVLPWDYETVGISNDKSFASDDKSIVSDDPNLAKVTNKLKKCLRAAGNSGAKIGYFQDYSVLNFVVDEHIAESLTDYSQRSLEAIDPGMGKYVDFSAYAGTAIQLARKDTGRNFQRSENDHAHLDPEGMRIAGAAAYAAIIKNVGLAQSWPSSIASKESAYATDAMRIGALYMAAAKAGNTSVSKVEDGADSVAIKAACNSSAVKSVESYVSKLKEAGIDSVACSGAQYGDATFGTALQAALSDVKPGTTGSVTLAIDGVEVTVSVSVDAHSYQNGECSVCGAPDPSYNNGGTTPTPTPNPEPEPTPAPVEGDVVTSGEGAAAAKYTVTAAADASGKGGEVEYAAPASADGTSDVVIPETIDVNGTAYTVTSIAANAFKDNTALKTVAIPSTVVKIGTSAFEGCSKLGSIKIPAGVKTIEARTFKGCKALKSVTTKATRIDSSAFAGCTMLAKVKAPNAKAIGKYAFKGDKKLESLATGASLTTIGASAFSGSKALTSITVTSKRLTKSGVKGSLKGSSVSKVVTKVGSVKANKNYAKKYKPLFTKKIAGKKATVTPSKKALKK